MSTHEESGGEGDRRSVEELAHALARSARRAQALGRRVHGTRPLPGQGAAKQPAIAPARASAAAPAVVPARGNPARELPARGVPDVQRPVTVRSAPSAAAASAHSGDVPRAVATSRAGPPARTALDVKQQAQAATTLDDLRARVAACEACSLCQTRTQTVFMDGSAERGVLFVGEAPGADEDRTGVPFVGRSGQLLTDIITKGMGLERKTVAIANVLKCRPPENRDPTTQEKAICTPWLDRQIELLDPRVIIPLGRHAAMHVLRVEASMGDMRQRVHDVGGRKIVPTFHPSYLLRSPGQKKECWKDIQLAMGIMGLAPGKPPGEPR